MIMASVKFKTPTCVLCRKRKLRCDGEAPCGPCSRARNLVVCTYIPKTAGQLRSEIPKGGACSSCRKRKRRCDGNLPCRTCKSTSRPEECQYRAQSPGRKPKPAEQSDPGHDRFSSQKASTSSSLPSRTTSRSYSPGSSSHLELPYDSDSTDDISSLLSDYPPLVELSELYAPNDGRSLGTDLLKSMDFLNFREVLLHSNSSSTSGTITLPFLPPLDRPILNYTLPFTGVSREAELSAVRNLFLDHCWHYGLNLTAEKRDALSRGDISGVLIHPGLVHVCQLLGYLIANHQSETWLYFHGQTENEADQAQAVFSVIHGHQSSLDPATLMQVYTLLSLYFGMRGDLSMCFELLEYVGSIVVQNHSNMRLDIIGPLLYASCSPQGPGQETRSAFCGMIWVDIGRSLVFKLPSILDPSLLATFRRLAETNWSDTELNFIRAKSALYLLDSQQLCSEWGHSDATPWSKRYWSAIEDINAHLHAIDIPLMEASFIHESQVLTLKTSGIIMALAALANLYALLAPLQPESRLKHSEIVDKIARISSTFTKRDYRYMDSTVGVGWSIALKPVSEDVFPHQSSEVRAHGASQSSLDIIRECNRKLMQITPFVWDA
ncbi:hypothetical protein DFH07DRAFT_841944 [Mycena maculata]|uniref:Zn(2)-C6 fungal-type domain-containing protein n=1 Tax=Mycena maculata TaxID=230809 RepID=A0AAD7MZP7_9AGAR|nr:hypothetical protein DFH07DRAFT_841944 [Mycena maculata]